MPQSQVVERHPMDLLPHIRPAPHTCAGTTPRGHIVLGRLPAIAHLADIPPNLVNRRIRTTTLHKEQVVTAQPMRMLELRNSIHRNLDHRAIILPMEAVATCGAQEKEGILIEWTANMMRSRMRVD
jgi:hypothetical protein